MENKNKIIMGKRRDQYRSPGKARFGTLIPKDCDESPKYPTKPKVPVNSSFYTHYSPHIMKSYLQRQHERKLETREKQRQEIRDQQITPVRQLRKMMNSMEVDYGHLISTNLGELKEPSTCERSL